MYGNRFLKQQKLLGYKIQPDLTLFARFSLPLQQPLCNLPAVTVVPYQDSDITRTVSRGYYVSKPSGQVFQGVCLPVALLIIKEINRNITPFFCRIIRQYLRMFIVGCCDLLLQPEA